MDKFQDVRERLKYFAMNCEEMRTQLNDIKFILNQIEQENQKLYVKAFPGKKKKSSKKVSYDYVREVFEESGGQYVFFDLIKQYTIDSGKSYSDATIKNAISETYKWNKFIHKIRPGVYAMKKQQRK